MNPIATVSIVDDDSDIRETLIWTLQSLGIQATGYATPEEVLRGSNPDMPGCFLIDLEMPRMNGFELQKQLSQRGCLQPFIIVSGHGDISLAVQAMQQGAVDFVEKPFSRRRLLDSVQRAIDRDQAQRGFRADQTAFLARAESLTKRELEIMDLVVGGALSKQIASQLDISMKTVEVHRSRIMHKLDVDSVADLVRCVTRFKLAAQ